MMMKRKYIINTHTHIYNCKAYCQDTGCIGIVSSLYTLDIKIYTTTTRLRTTTIRSYSIEHNIIVSIVIYNLKSSIYNKG